MSVHQIVCSLHARRLRDGKGVTLVRNFVVFIFCSLCWRTKRAGCEAMMDSQAGPKKLAA